MTKNYPNALMPTYNRLPIAFERGEGMYLFDAEGDKHLDFISGIAVNALGHAHPVIVDAIKKQSAKLMHVSNMYRIPEQEELAELLVENSTADSAFMVNSGVEAIEFALKAVRKYFYEQGQPERVRIITFSNAFHGRSLGAIAAAGKESLTKGFGPMLDGFDHVPFIDIAAVEDAITDETAAILLEPVQGEGGIRVATDEDMRALRGLADEHGLLLIADEIQCGMGRTGKFFASDWSGIAPDIIASAKGIGGGFPLGACLARASVAEAMGPGSHGTTYGGNPLASTVGCAVVKEITKDGFLDHVVNMGDYLMSSLQSLAASHADMVKDVRGRGLMVGIEIDRPVRPMQEALLKDGLLIGAAGPNVIRLLPALICEETHIDEAVEKLDSGLKALKQA